MKKLTRSLLARGADELAAKDADLARALERFGPPPLWGRQPGFATLVRIILEQQVSLASAAAVFRNLQSTVPEMTPEHIKTLSAKGLRTLGFTRQKAAYCEGLAVSIISGQVNLAELRRMEDEAARNSLLNIRSIGPWTANIYLLMALRRPDIWPDGDLALAESARRIKGLRKRPSYERLNKMAQKWTPWRSVAARILWHAYLSENGHQPGPQNKAV